jgi:hypothetical protein
MASHQLRMDQSPTKKKVNERNITLEHAQQDYKPVIDQKHPNTIAFDEDGRLFIGDSFGQINTWRIDI